MQVHDHLRRILFSVTVLIGMCAAIGRAADAEEGNLASNPSAEQLDGAGKPAGWEPLNVAAPAKFSVDDAQHHGDGTRSLRIDAGEVCRSYWRSDAIPVAPGESITASAWTRFRDVPPGQGTVILIAEFSDARGLGQHVAKFDTAKVTGTTADQQWQQVSGSLKVPAGAAQLRLRMGLSYSRGTVWWDDVRVQTASPLAVRIELPQNRLSPATGALTVTVLNRQASRGEYRIQSTVGESKSTQPVQLDGSAVQKLELPVQLEKHGTVHIIAELLPAGRHGDEAIFRAEQNAKVPRRLVLRPICPTHWAVEDGPATVEVAPDIAVARRQLDGAHLVLLLTDARGERTLWQWSPPAGTAIQDGINRFTVKLPEVPTGDYQIVAELHPGDGSETVRAQQPWGVIPRKLARVTLNEDGYLVADGTPVFPLGIFNGGAKSREMGEAGFTVNHAYNAANADVGEIPDDQAAKDFVDRSAANGMKVLMLIPRGLVFHGDWDGLRHRVRLLKNHPALLAWDEEEGIARGDMPPESLAKLRRVIAEEDPNHPLMVGDSRDIITRITDRSDFFPVAQMDLGMWWWYPIPQPPHATTGNALEGDEGAGGSELAPPTFLVKRNTDKPLWVGVQAYKKPTKTGRYPTPTEYRAQAYVALIHGAKGLMWYGGSVNGGIYLHPEEGHWDYLKTLARELNGLADVFMSPRASTPQFAPAGAPISAVLKQSPTRTVLLAANRGAAAAEVTFTLPASFRSASVLTENRTMQIQAGRLRDRFEPYQVHVYELRNPE